MTVLPRCQIQNILSHFILGSTHRFVHMYTNIQQDAEKVSCFIARSLYMFRALSAPIISSTITAVDSHWYNICYITVVDLELNHGDVTNRPILDNT
jgi:hypothetical protein